MNHTCHMMPEKWYVLLKIIAFFSSPMFIISPLQPSTPPFSILHTPKERLRQSRAPILLPKKLSVHQTKEYEFEFVWWRKNSNF